MAKIFIQKGSIYSPGWHIAEQVRENHVSYIHTFDTEAEALAELPYYQEHYS